MSTWPHDAKDLGPNWAPIPDMPGHYIYTKEWMPVMTRPTKLINEILKASAPSQIGR